MKNFERIFYIVALFSMFVFFNMKEPKTNTIIEVAKGDSITYVDSIPYDSLVYEIIDNSRIDSVWLHDTLFLPTDTSAILADYMKTIKYDSVLLRNDTSITNWVSIDVTQNRIKNIIGYSLNNRATAIMIKQEYRFGVGGIAGINIVAPTVSYRFKNHQFGLGYNLLNPGPILIYEYKFNLK